MIHNGESQPAPASSLVEALVRAEKHPRGEVCGLRFLDRRERATHVTWRQVSERARRTALGLIQLGIEPGDVVGIIYPTEPAFFDAFFGTLLAGAIPAPLYPPVRLGRLEEYQKGTARMLRSVKGRLVLASSRVKRIIGESVHAARPELGCLAVTELGVGLQVGHQAGLEGGRSRSDVELAAPRESDLALIQFSSGTTALPRPVALSHRAVLHQAYMLGDFVPDRPGEIHSGVSWLPLYHDMGLIGCVFTALCRPADLTLLPPELFLARPATWLRAISRYRGTVSPAPNFAYSLATERVRDEEMTDVDLSCWRLALNGAEAVTPDVVRGFVDRFSRWGLRPEAVTPVYGLAEAALAVTFSDPARPFESNLFERKALSEHDLAHPVARTRSPAESDTEHSSIELVSVGRPIRGFELEIRPDQRRGAQDGQAVVSASPLEDGRVGRIYIRGPSLMREYLGLPGETAAAFVEGWLDTGDLGFVHDGELFVVGRAKDVLVLRGKNHAPEVVENAIDGVSGVRRGCIVAVSCHLPRREPSTVEAPPRADPATESLLVFVERARGLEAPDESIASESRRRVLAATGLSVDRVVVLASGTLPRTSSGKLRRRETLIRYRAGMLSPPSPTGPWQIAGAMWRSRAALRRLAGAPAVDADREDRQAPVILEERRDSQRGRP